jgi:VWFA-related protein
MLRITSSSFTRLILSTGFLAVICAVSPAISQSAARAEPEDSGVIEPFFEAVEVEVVNIDVWVTDKQGTPVEGLGKEDFVALRDGQPVEISNFYSVFDGRPVATGRATAIGSDTEKPAGGPAILTPEKLRQVSPEHQLWLIVYIDNFNIDPIERRRVLPALREFLARNLRGGDQAMVMSYNRSLEIHQPFTNDSGLLFDALDAVSDYSGHAPGRERDQIETFQLIDTAQDPAQAMFYARQYAEQIMNGVDFTIDALRRMIDSLGGLPGRKALVHVSSGVPMLAGEEAFHAVAEKFNVTEAYGEISRHDTSRRFEKVNEHANAHRVTFYTLDAGGLRGMEFGGAEYGGFVDPRLRSILDSVVSENLQAPLRLMARETGGQTIVNVNDVLPALQRAATDFRSFYSLGIASAGTDEGRYHEIEVKLREKRKGAILRHRSGYRSKSTETRIREGLRSALLYEHQDNPLDIKVLWGRPRPHSEKGQYVLPIQLKVPLRNLVLLPMGPGKHEARLKLFVGAAGKDGQISQIEDSPFGVRLADEHVEAAKGESMLHTHQLLLSAGRKKVGVAIFDLFGRQSSVITGYIDVGTDS